MKARYQYRFYPTDQQRQSLAQLFGCVRVVWNDALAYSIASSFPGYNSLAKTLTLSKNTSERQWLNDVSSVPLQQSLKQLEVAYKNYFDSLKGKRKGKKLARPKFKKKTNAQSATFTKAGFSIKGESVYLAKIGDLNPVWSRELPSGNARFSSPEAAKTRTCSQSEPSSVTVIKDAANRYFLSFVVDVESVKVDAKRMSIGIDLGLKTFAFMSNGETAKSPEYTRLDKKLRRKQRKLARQVKGSIRREVTRLQIAKLHNQIADTRKDFLHKLSTKIVNENQVIVLEDLNVSGMVKNRRLSRTISLQGWREFRNLCNAKSEKLKRDFRVINRWEPTSQVCSDCGFRWGKVDLSIRSILCLNCNTEHDRDGNASKNIEMVGMGHRRDLKRTGSDCKTTNSSELL